MRKTLKVGNQTEQVTDKDYLAAGGEAAIYKSKRAPVVYKLYHDPKKCLPVGKIEELRKIQSNNVVKPLDVVYDTGGTPLGYSMMFMNGTHPLCKLFTKAFKKANSVTPEMTVELVKSLQKTVSEVHDSGCLIVDLNELNGLVGGDFAEVFLIDTDSFQTQSYPATAIMESIRDPLAKQFTRESDWFSFGVLAFQLYVNIHPYKGTHPDYLPKEWAKRMRDGISVFDSAVKLPTVCNPLTVVPRRHLDWFKSLFVQNQRSEPPLPDVSGVISVPIAIVQSQGDFSVEHVGDYDSQIRFRLNYAGVEWVVTEEKFFVGSKVVHDGLKGVHKAVAVPANEGTPVMAVRVNKNSSGWSYGTVGGASASGVLVGSGLFARNNCFYTVSVGKLIETSFVNLGGSKLVARTNEVDNISEVSAQVFDGMVIQNLLGKTWACIPYAQGLCRSIALPQLDGYRVLDAKSEKNVCVVIAEQGGTYHRFIFTFDAKTFASFHARQVKDVTFDAINFTVLDNGMCILLSSPAEIEMFKARPGDDVTVAKFNDPPFDSTMPLFTHGGKVYFANDYQVFKVGMRT